MARYIDAETLIEKYERLMKEPWNKTSAPPSWAIAWDCVIADIDDVPTADVVPKSEVEKLVQDSTRLVQENETLKDNNEHLAVILEETKAEVGSIFDELIKQAGEIAENYKKEADGMSVGEFARIEYKGTQIGALLVQYKIAELKKKYTEGEDKPAATEEKYFSPEDVRNMTHQEVREKYSAIRKSMEMW